MELEVEPAAFAAFPRRICTYELMEKDKADAEG